MNFNSREISSSLTRCFFLQLSSSSSDISKAVFAPISPSMRLSVRSSKKDSFFSPPLKRFLIFSAKVLVAQNGLGDEVVPMSLSYRLGIGSLFGVALSFVGVVSSLAITYIKLVK